MPLTPEEIVNEALACRFAGASVVHVHARGADGAWSSDADWYAETMRRIRSAAPDLLVSVTSIRKASEPIETILDLLRSLSTDTQTRPDLISINLGHITEWARHSAAHPERATIHYPNSYADIAALLTTCAEVGIVPELGVMDLGFISNAVTLQHDGLLPARPWFLIELDSPGFGSGRQVAPSSEANLELFGRLLGEFFPDASWAAHGVDLAGYAVLKSAISHGWHVRVGLEDTLVLPDGRLSDGNAPLVEWAVSEIRRAGREVATPDQARRIIGIAAH